MQAPKRKWPTWAIPALAALLVLVLIGGAALLFASPKPADVVDQNTVPTFVEDVELVPSGVDQITVPTVVEGQELLSTPPTSLPEAVEPRAPITGVAWQQITPDGIEPTVTGNGAFVSGGDRFLYLDGAKLTVSESLDGVNWATRPVQGSVDGIYDFVGWRQTLVGFGCDGWHSVGESPRLIPNPGCVSVVHVDGTVARHSFDGQINAVGIGSHGMVVIVTDSHDEDGLEYAHPDEMAMGLGGRDINDYSVVELTDGVLHLETFDGQVSDFVISDHGYVDNQEQFASGWFSPDGKDWTVISDFPAGKDWDLIGTEDGFVGISDDRDDGVVAWHSSTGLDWRELGPSLSGGSTLGRWGGGAVVVGTARIWYLSGGGIEETPLASTAFGESLLSATGGVGVVIVDFEDGTMDLKQILYSPDGQAWINTSVPLELEDLSLAWPMFYDPIEVIVTDTGVLLVAFPAGDQTPVWPPPVFILGTPITD